jgi:hypothetical protein
LGGDSQRLKNHTEKRSLAAWEQINDMQYRYLKEAVLEYMPNFHHQGKDIK